MSKRWKKRRVFSHCACFFQHCDPHETLYFTIRKLLFHFSCFCVFSENTWKNMFQNGNRVQSHKNHSKIVPGDPFWSPQCYRINVRELQKPKICETIYFSERAVFSTFFRVRKSYTVNSARRRRGGVEKLTIPRSNGWHVRSRVVLLGKPSICLRKVRLDRQTNDLWPLAPAK